MNPTVNLSFRYLERDYARALRAHYATQLHPRRDILVAAVVAIIGIYFWRSEGSHWLGGVCVAVSVAFVLIVLAAFTIVPRLVFRSEPKFRDDYSLTFSAEGIHFRTAHIDSNLQWSMYSRALVDTYSYMLYYGSRRFTLIPKRVFPDDEQQRAFEELLRQHIPRIVTRDKRLAT
jgi:hypothetical protein